mgnify:CR=1 FL=1
MTPQSAFMVLAVVIPDRESRLRELLASMNHAPGRVDRENRLVPFARFPALHMARLVLLDDKTTGDVRAHGLEPREYPLYLAFLGDIDGAERDFLEELAAKAGEGLREIFSCCEGFSPEDDLVGWMWSHRSPPLANYVNTRGRTVRQVHQEAALYEALEKRMDGSPEEFAGLNPREVHSRLRKFSGEEQAAGRLTLSPEEPTPAGWWIRDKLHLVGMPLLMLLLSPILLLALPVYLIILRHREKTDPEVVPVYDQEAADHLSELEDHDVTNQFSAMGSLKPGLFRLLTTYAVLGVVDYAARHLVHAGRLGRIRTIHFARWVFVAGKERMIFCSNYDGSVESYMDDFINKTGFGLNASFSNGIGYPRTNWLIRDGCRAEGKYKEYLRRHTLPTQVWYKAYPGLTAVDLERNTRIRKGLDTTNLSREEALEWAKLL